MSVAKTIYKDLLDRYVLMEQAITAQDSSGNTLTIVSASPRLFEPMGGSWPIFRNYINSVQIVRASAQVEDHIIRVASRLLGGPVSSGYQGEFEDRLNYFYFPVTDYFSARPHLNHPSTGAAFDYLHPEKGAEVVSIPAGTQGFRYDVAEVYFGAEWISQVTLRLPKSRIS